MFIWMMQSTLPIVCWFDSLMGAMHIQAKQLVEVILHDAVPEVSCKRMTTHRSPLRIDLSFAIEILKVRKDSAVIRDAAKQVSFGLNKVINCGSSDIRSVAVANRVERW